MTFDVGDKVVYPHHGAAIIERREKKEAFGEKRDYLVLRLAYGDLTLMVPADNTEEIGLREVINDEEVEEVFAVLRKKEARMPTNWSRRFKNHVEKLKSGDIYQVAEVVRNLSHPREGQGPVGGREAHAGPGPPDPRVRAHLRAQRRRGGGRGPPRRGAQGRRQAAARRRRRHRPRRPPRRSSGATPMALLRRVWAVDRRRRVGVSASAGPKQFADARRRAPGRPRRGHRRRGRCDAVVRRACPTRADWEGAEVDAARRRAARPVPSRCGPGLRAVPTGAEIVVVHDAARPLASAALFDAVIGAVRDGADGAVPGLAVADTLKRVDDVRVTATVDRDGLVAVQTPQAFRADVLRAAHAARRRRHRRRRAGRGAAARVVVVPGDPRNLKITGPADLDDRRRPARGVVTTEVRRGHPGRARATTSTRSPTTVRPLVLGGVASTGAGLAGHSDADVVAPRGRRRAARPGRAARPRHAVPGVRRRATATRRRSSLLRDVVARVRGGGLVGRQRRRRGRTPRSRGSRRTSSAMTDAVASTRARRRARVGEAQAGRGIGAVGRGEGIQCWAVALLESG